MFGFVYDGFFVINEIVIFIINNMVLFNEDLIWEILIIYDVGFDVVFLDNSLMVFFDYFYCDWIDVLAFVFGSVLSILGVGLVV